MKKLHKSKLLKEYNYLFDFENIYEELNRLVELNKNKKLQLLIEVKPIKNCITINPTDLIYNNKNLSFIFMELLKEPDAPYTFDILFLIKGNNINNNSQLIINEIEKIIQNNQNNNNLFNFENTSIYYISYIISLLNDVIQKNIKDKKFIAKFLKSYILNYNIKNLNILKKDYNSNNNY